MKQRKQTSPQPSTSKTSAQRSSSALFTTIEHFFASFALRWNPVLTALVVNAALCALTYLLWTPQFNTRDDIGMMLLSAGKIIALEPTEYLLFTNIIIGHLLKALYSAMPSVAWYALYLVASLFLAHTALLYLFLRKFNNLLTVVLYVAYFLVLGTYLFLSLQFTMIASIVAIAGMALLFFLPDNKKDEQQPWFARLRSINALCGIGLIVWADMIRMESLLLIAACTLPIVAVDALFSTTRKRLLLQLPALGVAMLLCAAVVGYNSYRYEHWGTENAVTFNKLYGHFLDFGADMRVKMPPEEFNTIMQRVGWSAYDFEILMNWFFMDETVFSTEKLTILKASFEEYDKKVYADAAIQKEVEANRAALRSKLVDRQIATFSSTTALFATALALFCGCFMFTMNRYSLLKVALFMCSFAGLALYVNYQTLMRDMPERVFYPLFAYASLLPFLIAGTSVQMGSKGDAIALRQKTTLRLAVGAVALVAVLVGTWSAVSKYAGLSTQAATNRSELQRVMAAFQPKPENLYVIWADGFPLGSIAPFDGLTEFVNFHALWLSWAQRTPTAKATLARYNIQNIYTSIATQNNVKVLFVLNQLASPALVYHQRLNQYIKEHYGKNVLTKPDGVRYLPPYAAGTKPDPYSTYVEMSIMYQP